MPATIVKLDVKKEPDFLIEATDTQVVITGTTFIMPQFDASAWASKHLTIRAYHVTLTENIVAPGKHVSVLARKLTINAPVTISTAGRHATDWPAAANDGRTAGANGTAGRHGQSGGDGGAILLACEDLQGMPLTLDTSGGNGGRGEAGGNGAQGANGRDGSAGKFLHGEGHSQGEHGGDGGKGGGAGAGGSGGNGGNAGTINVHIPFEPQERGLAFIVEPGRGGQLGANGNPGPGGAPGRGGQGFFCFCEGEPGHGGGKWGVGFHSGSVRRRGPCYCNGTERAPSGNIGPAGQSATPQASGIDGNNGTIQVVQSNGLDIGIASHSLLSMCLYAAEDDYLNNRRQSCAEKLLWLLDCTNASISLSQETVDIASVRGMQDGNPIKDSIKERAHVLLTQLAQGLNYYGLPPNHVPLTSLTIYEQAIDSMLQLAADIETAYTDYHLKGQDDIKRLSAIGQSVSSLELQISTMKTQADQLKIEVSNNRKEIAQLLEQQLALEIQLKDAQKTFVHAVEKESGCGFKDVLTATASVAAIASGVGSVAGGIAALGQSAELIKKSKSLKDWKKTGDFLSTHWGEVQGGVGGISKGYDGIKGILEEDRDAAKLITTQDNFEEEMRPYLHLNEAQAYLKLMRMFTHTTTLRNNKIFETDTKVALIHDIESEQKSLRVDIDLTNARLIEVFNPRIAEHIIFFERAIMRAKAYLMRSIVMEHRALAYWSLNEDVLPGDLHTRSVDYLKTYQLRFKQQLLSARESRNSEPMPFESKNIVIDRNMFPVEWAIFDKTGRLMLALNETHSAFAYTARVLVNEAKCQVIHNEPTELYTSVILRHHGDARFIDLLGVTHHFTHRYRQTLRHELAPNENSFRVMLGGGTNYAFLSPLATWSIIMEFAGNDNLPLSEEAEHQARENIKALSLSFSGVADSRYGMVN
jgi:hypothetical protein